MLGALFATDIPLCPSKNLLGIPCPGCGLTRATAALFSGELGVAMAYHPLFPVIVPLVFWLVLRTVLVSAGLMRTGAFDPLARLPRWLWIAFGVMLIGIWALRLAGHIGGHPDGVHPEDGILGAAFLAIVN